MKKEGEDSKRMELILLHGFKYDIEKSGNTLHWVAVLVELQLY